MTKKVDHCFRRYQFEGPKKMKDGDVIRLYLTNEIYLDGIIHRDELTEEINFKINK